MEGGEGQEPGRISERTTVTVGGKEDSTTRRTGTKGADVERLISGGRSVMGALCYLGFLARLPGPIYPKIPYCMLIISQANQRARVFSRGTAIFSLSNTIGFPDVE